jgi:hypothetical protein
MQLQNYIEEVVGHMQQKGIETSFVSLLNHFKDVKIYIKEHFNKDGLLKALLLEFERPFEDGLLENVKQLKRLDDLDIPIHSEELNVEKSYHQVSDNFQKLNVYVYETYPGDVKLRGFLTHILMILQDLGEHYYHKAIKERDNNKTDNPKKVNKDRVLQ